jgi:hypothetical protein
LLSAENWWEALAVCEYALDTKEDEKLTEDFFELIFSAFDCNVEVELNAEEYEFWWERYSQKRSVFRMKHCHQKNCILLKERMRCPSYCCNPQNKRGMLR